MSSTSGGARLHTIAVELAAMAQNGLTYSTDHHDIERYLRTRELSSDVLALLAGGDPEEFAAALSAESGHATPKVDVRGALFDAAERVLLVREAHDGRWALPGGWADALDTPSEAIEREVAEEAGLAVRAVKLAAVHDGSRRNGHAGSPWHIYKHLFLLARTPARTPAPTSARTLARTPAPTTPTRAAVRPGAGDVPVAGLDGETTDVGFFGLDELPELSTGRTTEEQLRLLLQHHRAPGLPTDFD